MPVRFLALVLPDSLFVQPTLKRLAAWQGISLPSLISTPGACAARPAQESQNYFTGRLQSGHNSGRFSTVSDGRGVGNVCDELGTIACLRKFAHASAVRAPP